MSKLQERVAEFVSLDQKLEELLSEHFPAKFVKKGTLLARDGFVNRYLYFIEEGYCRSYYYQNDKEVTNWIFGENQFVTTWGGFINNTEAKDYIEAISNMEIRRATHEGLHYIYDQSREFERFGRYMMEQYIAFQEEFERGYAFASAKERYDALLDIYPDITRIAKLGHIASILGITQETLSRIRKMK